MRLTAGVTVNADARCGSWCFVGVITTPNK
jgi:hypothetical protein